MTDFYRCRKNLPKNCESGYEGSFFLRLDYGNLVMDSEVNFLEHPSFVTFFNDMLLS